MEQESRMSEEEARKEGEELRLLAEDLSVQDQMQKPESSHYQEASRAIDARSNHPQRGNRGLDANPSVPEVKDLEDSVT